MSSHPDFHPVCGLLPLMQGREFEALVADVRENGLREAILLDPSGQILDGRNRYRACREAGVEPAFTTWDGDGSPLDVVLSRNVHRRQLTERQRALVAARAKVLFEQEARERMQAGKAPDPAANLRQGRSAERVAAIFAISTRLVEYATRLLERGSPELVQAVETGRLAVSTASDLAELPQAEQAELASRSGREAVAKAREIREKRAGGKRGPDPEAWQAALRRCTSFLDRELAKLDGPDQEKVLAAIAARLVSVHSLPE